MWLSAQVTTNKPAGEDENADKPETTRLLDAGIPGSQSIHSTPYTFREGFHLITLILIPTPFNEQVILQLQRGRIAG